MTIHEALKVIAEGRCVIIEKTNQPAMGDYWLVYESTEWFGDAIVAHGDTPETALIKFAEEVSRG